MSIKILREVDIVKVMRDLACNLSTTFHNTAVVVGEHLKRSMACVLPLQYIVPETHPPTSPLSLSHIPLSSLFIFLGWITVIYSQVNFSWAITGVEEGWRGRLTRSWRLSSLVFHLAIISSNRGPSHWHASYALVRHVAFLLDFEITGEYLWEWRWYSQHA